MRINTNKKNTWLFLNNLVKSREYLLISSRSKEENGTRFEDRQGNVSRRELEPRRVGMFEGLVRRVISEAGRRNSLLARKAANTVHG